MVAGLVAAIFGYLLFKLDEEGMLNVGQVLGVLLFVSALTVVIAFVCWLWLDNKRRGEALEREMAEAAAARAENREAHEQRMQEMQEAHERGMAAQKEAHEAKMEHRRREREVLEREEAEREHLDRLAKQLWSKESREFIVAANEPAFDDPDFGPRRVELERHLGSIFGAQWPFWWTNSYHHLHKGFVEFLERVTRMWEPTAENLRIVWDAAIRYDNTKDFLDPRYLTDTGHTCRRCAVIERFFPREHLDDLGS